VFMVSLSFCLIHASCWANAPRWGGRLRCWLAAPLPLPQTVYGGVNFGEKGREGDTALALGP
jgi:hypothetical protein